MTEIFDKNRYNRQIGNCNVSAQADTINQHRSIVQGSGLGLTLYPIILESDLKPKSSINKIFKYADDTNLLVPVMTDVELCEEFIAVQDWALINKMTINMAETKELVFFHRPNPRQS